MKLNVLCKDPTSGRRLLSLKMLLIMKLTLILMIAACLQVNAGGGYAQKITLSQKNVSLAKLFHEIRDQSGYLFLYNDKQLDNGKKVTINVRDASIEEVLNQSFKHQSLTYTIIEKTIVVMPKEKEEAPALIPEILPPPIEIHGMVKDDNGNPLANASVIIKGMKQGVNTNASGGFNITVPDAGTVLVISYTDHVSKEILVGSQTTINVNLVRADNALSEVVITALGIQRNVRSLSYSPQKIAASQLNGVRDANNLVNSFQGKVANAVITQGSGGVGSGGRMVLRGNRSIQGNNSALFVVDGVPIINTTGSAKASDFGSLTGSDGVSNLNPDDIESVTILPGASAAVLYGSEAANGAVIITTKKGTKDKLSVSINSGWVMESPFSLPEVQNEYGQGFDGAINTAYGTSWGAKMDGQSYKDYLGNDSKYAPQPDNIKDFFKNGLSANNSIGISGGTEKVQTYLSYAYNQLQGIIPNNDLNRHTVNFRITNQITSKLSADAKVTYINQQIDGMPKTGETNSPVMDIYQTPRNVATEDALNYQQLNNLGYYVPTPWPARPKQFYQNPYWVVNRTNIGETRDRIMGFVSLKYKLTGWLSLSGKVNIDKTIDNRSQAYSTGTVEFATKPGGYYQVIKADNTLKWFELMLSGANSFAKDWNVAYNIGALKRRTDVQSSLDRADGLNVPNRFNLNFSTSPFYSESGYQFEVQSLFGQANLSYKNAIFVDGSYRKDWNSVFPKPYSYGYYSIGASVVVSDLLSMPQAISYLKLNGNYSQSGNGGLFGILESKYDYQQGGTLGYISRSATYPIPDLKPEIVDSREFGGEIMLFANRLGVTVTNYRSTSKNQLLQVSVPPATGYSTKYVNAGKIINKGWEFILKAKPVNTKNFNWDVSYNLSMNKNKIISLIDGVSSFSLATDMSGGKGRAATPFIKVGGSYGDIYAQKWQRNDKEGFVVNSNGLPVLTPTQEYIGNFNPKSVMGLWNSLTYKRFSLSALIDGRTGGIIVSGTEMNIAYSGIPKFTEQFREGGWSFNGTDANGSPVSQSVKAQDFWRTVSLQRFGAGEFFAYNATNFRLRELSFGYDVPLPSTLFIKSIKISLVARNLVWLYRGKALLDIPGLEERKMWMDPDMSISNQNFQGVDYGTLPSTRSYGVNLRLNF